uniref:CSON008532 protein n=1 Tax=Culicoides sonorensis TaxID=179676 RepID=A0A336LYR6_CULSO
MFSFFHNGCQVLVFYLIIFLGLVIHFNEAAKTMKQLEKTMETLRNTCTPQFPSLSQDMLNGIKTGGFLEDNKDLKCYIKCIADMAGTTTKKGDIDMKKSNNQIESLIPLEMKDHAKAALNACKEVSKNYKDPCEKVFYTAKCSYEFGPDKFMFP